MRPFLLLLLPGLLVPCGTAAQSGDGWGELLLRPGDALRLQVQNEPQFAGEYPLVEDGTVLLPIVGAFSVAGRPFARVRAEILAAYGEELVGSTVLVSPVLRIPVLGEVRQPGLLPVDPTLSVAEVLASAGGLTPDGDPERIRLVRDGTSTVLPLEGSTGEEVRLRSGDRIVVGQRSWVSRNGQLLLSVGGSVLTAVLTALILR